MRRKLSNKGFSIVEVVIALAVLAALGLGGWYVWHKHNETKTSKSNTTSTSKSSTRQKPSGSQQLADPYVGWKTYADSLYGYSFKYPADWKLIVGRAPQELCDAGEVSLTSTDGSVTMSYQNDNNHDGGVETITPVSVNKLSVAGQDLTALGSYSTASSSFYPSYAVVDTSWTSSYPLTVGQASQFPQPAEFTDQTTSMHCQGSFSAQPSQPANSVTSAQAWFGTADARTSLQVLKSFTRQ